MNIVLGCEYGRGFARQFRLLALAQQLKNCGHTVKLMTHDFLLTLPFNDWTEGIEVLPTPNRAHGQYLMGGKKTTISSHLNKLAVLGFYDPDVLHHFFKGYQNILQAFEPQFIILDSAPLLQLYGKIFNIPIIELGDAFDIPCLVNNNFPSFAPGKPSINNTILEKNIDHVARKCKLGSPISFDDYFFNHQQFIVHHPILDPLSNYRVRPIYQRFMSYDGGAIGPVKTIDAFVYLSPQTPNLDRLVVALQKLNITGYVFIPFIGSHHKKFLETIGFTVFSACPKDLMLHLLKSKIVIHIGGMTVTDWCIAHQIPQLIIPCSIKNIHCARRIRSLGAGDYIETSTLSLDDLVQQLKRFITHNFTEINHLIDSKMTHASLTPECVMTSVPRIIQGIIQGHIDNLLKQAPTTVENI